MAVRKIPTPPSTTHEFGHEVLGPVLGEFCLHLWQVTAMLPDPDAHALLWCARGGLRLRMAYGFFLEAVGLDSPVLMDDLMVSRVVAIRPAIAAAVAGRTVGMDATADVLAYEFRRVSVDEAVSALVGCSDWADDEGSTTARGPVTLPGLVAELNSPRGRRARQMLIEQASLFVEHLDERRAGRRAVILVDTGLYGTTADVLSEGVPALKISSLLLARSFRPTSAPRAGSHGLSVSAAGYSPLERRTALLRYWHFVEWLFEPPLPSVRSHHRVFDTSHHSVVESNLQVPGWADQLLPPDESVLAGALDYIRQLSGRPAMSIYEDADRAWSALSRALVRPSTTVARLLHIGRRSVDFGLDDTWTERDLENPWAALRGSGMWREGEVARPVSSSSTQVVVQTVLQAAHVARWLRRLARDPRSWGSGPASVKRTHHT